MCRPTWRKRLRQYVVSEYDSAVRWGAVQRRCPAVYTACVRLSDHLVSDSDQRQRSIETTSWCAVKNQFQPLPRAKVCGLRKTSVRYKSSISLTLPRRCCWQITDDCSRLCHGTLASFRRVCKTWSLVRRLLGPSQSRAFCCLSRCLPGQKYSFKFHVERLSSPQIRYLPRDAREALYTCLNRQSISTTELLISTLQVSNITL